MGAETPRDERTLIAALQRASARLDWAGIVWERKNPPEGGSGNFGWYVTDVHPENRERWYVRAAHGIAVRRAIPRDQLEEWERFTRRSARDVKRDYREATGRGSHAWYIETYRGEVWRTTKGGYGKKGVTVTRLDVSEEAEARRRLDLLEEGRVRVHGATRSEEEVALGRERLSAEGRS
ncbi:hypothetical protein NBM05_09075 [Rothia sp. AR01]|uniref:Uncharacterized protein n=1 Tax=Rothia santali TaxID=2949643 RepID=A0A9X2HJN8_9MICC|nr:hypothetical protein [Rothia santali]MCP3426153.1 hypothetical protein [Rothia santali]